MQNTNHGDAVVGCSKVDHVALDAPSAVAWPDVITGWGSPGRGSQAGEGPRQQVDVAHGLLDTPFPHRMNPD